MNDEMEIIFCLKYIYTSIKYYHEKENDEIRPEWYAFLYR